MIIPSSNFFYLICWIFSSLCAIFSARRRSCCLFVSCIFKSILYYRSRFSNCFFYLRILWSASRLSRPPVATLPLILLLPAIIAL